jgi:hypothetical protein
MKTLNEVVARPSALDGRDNYTGGTEFPGWLVVMTKTRDADILDRANWDAALALLGGRTDVQIYSFGHWAFGRWDALCILEGSESHAIALDIASRLASYPVLDESLYSGYCVEDSIAAWKAYGADDFREALAIAWGAFAGVKCALDGASSEDLWAAFEGAGGDYETGSDGTHFSPMGPVALGVDMEDVIPAYMEEQKQIRKSNAWRAGDIFANNMRWFWDDKTPFILEERQ